MCIPTDPKLRKKLVWVPGHISKPGNEKVDTLANSSLNLPTVKSKPLGRKDVYDAIDKFITGNGKLHDYDNSATARHYKLSEPVNYHIKYTQNICKHETSSTRLRLYVCLLL
jgi:hypothetical protein